MKLYFLATLLSVLYWPAPQHTLKRSTNFYIYANKGTSCGDDLGYGLSRFFDEVDGYGKTAEVEQVGRVLNIDLSIFRDIDYDMEDSAAIEKHWHSIDSFLVIVDMFLVKIHMQPDYYKKVVYNPDFKRQQDEYIVINNLTDTVMQRERRRQLESAPFYYYPPDRGYLSNNGLTRGLNELKQRLCCFKKGGATKVRMVYM